jgi:predicted MFS family arabinose efflux permease
VALVFFTSAGPVEVAYAKATLLAGDRGYGLLLTVWGVGAVLGGLIFARLVRRPRIGTLSVSALAIGVGYAGFAAAPSLILACIAALVGGAGNGVEIPSTISVVQRLTPQHLHGSLMGAVESLSALSLAFGLPLGGALVALSSPRAAFWTIGVGTVVVSAALLRASRQGPEAVASGEERLSTEKAGGQLAESLSHGTTPH